MADISSIDLSDVHWTVRFGGTTQRGLVKRWAPRIGGDAEGRGDRAGERGNDRANDRANDRDGGRG